MPRHPDKQLFGNDWKAQADIYPAVLKDTRRDNLANITITCTDNIKSRIDLWNLLRALPQPTYCTYETPLYWMDFGNTQTTGQVVLGTVPKKIKQPASKLYETVNSLKVITRMVKYTRVKETDSGPSCSLAEALENRTCSSTPHWHNSDAASYGKCSETE